MMEMECFVFGRSIVLTMLQKLAIAT